MGINSPRRRPSPCSPLSEPLYFLTSRAISIATFLNFTTRITSYNVCYTKLLRFIGFNHWNSIFGYWCVIFAAFVVVAVDFRITSYNVCYTKLLRNKYKYQVKQLHKYWYLILCTWYQTMIIAKVIISIHRAIYYIELKLLYSLNFQTELSLITDFMISYSTRITSYNVCYTKLLRIVDI